MIVTVGIDPGKSGGIAVVANGSQILVANKMPTSGKEYLPADMQRLLLPFGGIQRDRTCTVQLVSAFNALVDAVQDTTLTEDAFAHLYDQAVETLSSLTVAGIPRAQLAMLEKQRGMKGEGPERLVQTGKGWGLWAGILATLGIPYEEVAAGTWQRTMGCLVTSKTAQTRREKKAVHIAAATRLFPDRSLKPSDDGIADALLLAVYAYRRHMGRSESE